MKADYTRFTFRPRKRFTSVRLQQGRVQLDSDWNELEEITEHLERTEARDVIGVRGAPEDGGGFAVEALDVSGADFRLTNGRIYVGGLLCELQPEQVPILGFPADKIELPTTILDGRPVVEDEWLELDAAGRAPQLFRVTKVEGAKLTLKPKPSDFAALEKNSTARRALTYMTQPELPDPDPPVAKRTDLVYLDVWQRHVTAVEDPEIREEALLGPDTATRIQTVCQVKIAPGKKSCKDIDSLTPPAGGGRLSTRATPGTDTENLCLVPPGGGYTALENRLYRVEVHDSGNPSPGNATFKWSRYNGAVAFPVARFGDTGDRIWLSGLGDDDVLRLAKDDWVEVLDDRTELAGGTGTFVMVDDVDPGERSIRIKPALSPNPFEVTQHARVRRWDEDEDANANGVVKMGSVWTGLENGVEICFTGGDFKAGDYWAFAARANTGRVDVLNEAPPRNIEHHLCPLAIVEWAETGMKPKAVHDCRPPFVSLVDLLSQRVLRYVAGDGQEGRPGAPLPGELIVGVEDGLGRPVKDYDVVFTATGGGSLNPGGTASITATTGADGLARCKWQLGPDPDVLGEVTAALKTTPSPQTKSVPVVFRATSYYLSLRYLSGDGQNGRAGHLLPAPLVVGVEDAGGRPVVDAKLTFKVAAGGGFVGKAGADPTTGNFDTKTDASGEASAVWLLGADPDDMQEVTATLDGVPPAPGSVGQDSALRLVFRARPHYLALRYVTGDGREGKPGDTLTDPPLTVGVEDGDGRPVAGVNVVFTPSGNAQVREPGGALSAAAITVASDAHGNARCEMQLGDTEGVYTTTATLDPSLGQDESLAIIFRGLAEPPGEHGDFPVVKDIKWDNDGPLSLTLLNRGLEVTFSHRMDPLCLKKRELFVVTVELAEDDPAGKHVGFRSHILHGKLTATANNTRWKFTPQPHVTEQTLKSWKAAYVNKLHMDEGIRLRVVLKAEGIRSEKGLQLDGESFWTEGPAGFLGKLERAGDGHQGGDFESWAFLVPPPEPTPEPTPTPTPFVVLEPTPFLHTIPPSLPPGFFPHDPLLPLTRVAISTTGGNSIAVVDSGEARPSIAVSDEAAVIEMEVAEPVVEDEAIAFADSLRLVDKATGEVVSGAPEWLPGNRLRITMDGPLASGDYVVVRDGDPSANPMFGFNVS